ncbi:hypothetical protein COCNU_scaffold002022G000020 [Cocos nucifera]|nr:hypothetical protein [Cocos nucifera]
MFAWGRVRIGAATSASEMDAAWIGMIEGDLWLLLNKDKTPLSKDNEDYHSQLNVKISKLQELVTELASMMLARVYVTLSDEANARVYQVSLQEKAIVEVHWQKVTKLEEALKLSEAALEVAKKKMEVVKAQNTMEKSKVVVEAKSQAMELFKASTDFEAEVAKGFVLVYSFRFDGCKAQVAWFFHEVDTSHIDPEASNNEVEEEDRAVSSLATELEITPTSKPAFELVVEEAP